MLIYLILTCYSFSKNEILGRLQTLMKRPIMNEMKKPLWRLLSRLKTGEQGFDIETYRRAVLVLLDENGLTACPLWNITNRDHAAYFERVKNTQNTLVSEIPTSEIRN